MVKRSDGRLRVVLISAILICVVLNPLNSSTISVALSTLLHALHTNQSGITWIVSGYYLGSAIAQPVMGKLGDAFGSKRFVYSGLVVMIVVALLAPLSTSLWQFVAWRIIQAIGTSMIYPNAISLIRNRLPNEIGKILGWIGMGGGVAVAVGPTIGGLLMDAASWHSIFWLNVPLALAAMLMLYIADSGQGTDKAPPRDGTGLVRQLDWLGMVLFTFAITAWLIWSQAHHLMANPNIWYLPIGAVLTVLLMVMELRHHAPIIPVRWFAKRQFLLSSFITVLVNLVMYCILYGFPLFLETIRHQSATRTGLLLLSFAGVMSVFSPLGGRFAAGRRRKRPQLIAGLALSAGTLILCFADHLPILVLTFGLAFIGLSFAISNVVIQQIVLESVPKQDTGQASGVYTLLRYLGTIISSVLIGGTMSTGASSAATRLFITLFIVSLVTVFFTLGLRDKNLGGASDST